MPFELPKGWVWCRLGDIGSWKAGATPSRKESRYYEDGDIPWLKTGDLNDGIIHSVPEFISSEAVAKTSVRLNPIGSILIAMYGATIGKIGILNIEATTNQACCACIVEDGIYNKYIFYFLMARRNHFKALGGGGAQPNISKEIIVSYLFALPPLAEQKIIVANIEGLFKIADSLDEADDGLKKATKCLDKKILDLAIRGKLVPQDPNDEPASVLLEKILAGKDAKASKGKASHRSPNQKSGDGILSPTETQSRREGEPFELPQGWVWCRLESLGTFTGGHTPSTNDNTLWGDEVVWVTSKDMKAKYIENSQIKISQKGAAELVILKPNSIIMCTRSGILRRKFPVAIAKCTLTINQDQRALTLWLPEMSEYIYLVLRAMENLILTEYKKTGTTVESIIWNKFTSLSIPLPPLQEQKRIVKKVEELRKSLSSILPS